MLNEKEISILSELRSGYSCFDTEERPYYDALSEGIKALRLAQEPCEDAISRQAALDCLYATKLKKFDFILHAREEIKKLPPVNPQPKIGHWTRVSMDKYVQHAMAFYRCSECGKDIIGEHNFCPNCGCRMVDPQESENCNQFSQG